MAQFKEVTQPGGVKTVINMDLVRTMERHADTTTIHFDREHYIYAEETPNDIMMGNQPPTM